jgi:hypothetical protein
MMKNNRLLWRTLLTMGAAWFISANLVYASPLLEKAAAFLGISVSPSQLRGLEEFSGSGEIWLFDLKTGQRKKISLGGGYHSPLFLPMDEDLLALKGSRVVRLRGRDGKEETLFTIDGIEKLIGFHGQDQDKVLVLYRGDHQTHVPGVLSLASGRIEPLSFDRTSEADRRLLAHLSSWERSYGPKKVFVRRQSGEDLSGTIEWTDVFFKQEGQDPINVSRGEGVNCGQPSLSHNGVLVTYIREGLQ